MKNDNIIGKLSFKPCWDTAEGLQLESFDKNVIF